MTAALFQAAALGAVLFLFLYTLNLKRDPSHDLDSDRDAREV